MNNYRSIVIVVGVLFASGCGTYSSLQHRQSADPIVFGGLRTDAKHIVHNSAPSEWLQKQKLYNPYIDLPFSALLDIVLLPYTVSYAVSYTLVN